MKQYTNIALVIATIGMVSLSFPTYTQAQESTQNNEAFRAQLKEQWHKKYEAASDEEKAIMDAQRAEFMAKREAFKNASPEEKQAAINEWLNTNKRSKAYEAASDVEKAKMDAERAEFLAKREELKNLSPDEKKAAISEWLKTRNSPNTNTINKGNE